MSKKLVKCRSCGEEIAKTARACPYCGAQQHQVALAACAIIIVLAVVACMCVLIRPSNSNARPASTAGAESTSSTLDAGKVIFSGSSASVTYMEAFDDPSVSGCYYIKLQIENTGDADEFIYLEDVYTDDLACTSGSGVPVKVLPGKKANGSFIVFYDGDLDNASTVEFKVVIADDETMDRIETSEQIKIQLK